MKQVMITLPLIEIEQNDQLLLKETYPEVGRYVVRRPNGDVSVVDVYGFDATFAQLNEAFLGQPTVHEEEEFVLREELETVTADAESQIEDLKSDISQIQKTSADVLKSVKEAYDLSIQEIKASYEKSIGERIADIRSSADTDLAARRAMLEDEYDRKKLQLDLDTPKRFAQGEWVSGKTLTEIVKTLACARPSRQGDGQEVRTVTTLLEPGEYHVSMGFTATVTGDGLKVVVEPVRLK